MGEESIDVDVIERWFLFAPMVVLILGWLQLNLILLGYKTSILSVLIFLPLSLIIVKKLAPKAASKNNSSKWVLLTLVLIITLCEFIRPATNFAVQYDGAYHILQASIYADVIDFHPFSGRIFRPPLLPVLLSTTLVFDEGGSLSLLMLRCIVLLFGLQTYILGKKLGASTIPATIFAAAAITSPTVIDWGGMYYHGVFAAMLATMTMNLLLNIDWKKCSAMLMLLIGFSSGGVALARYSFSYLLGVIGFSGLMTKKVQPMIWFILAWSVAVLPFMLNDWMETGDLLASLRPQINAPVDRALDPVEGVGWSAENFPILGYLDLRLDLLSDGVWLLGLGGIGLLIRDKKWRELAVLSAIAIPHVMIYSLLLGYGEERYMLLVVPLWCALAALSFEPVVQWVHQLIHPQPKSLDDSHADNIRKGNMLQTKEERFDSAVRPAVSCMVVLLVVFAPLVSHLVETNESHWKTGEWVNMMRSIADDLPDDVTIVASSKNLQMMWLTKEPSKEPPPSFESLHPWLNNSDVSHILTRNRGTPEPCAKDVTLCIEAPWLIPVVARSESSGWMVLWGFDMNAGEYQSSNLSIESFVTVENQWRGHNDGAIDLIRNDLIVVRHYDDEVTLDPAFFNATSIEIDIVVFRFDAWPDAAIDLEYGRINDLSKDDRFYAASWNGSSFAHSGPFADSAKSLPTSLNESFTFSPSDYGYSGAAGVHYIRLRAIND